jgi:hypothetical protein
MQSLSVIYIRSLRSLRLPLKKKKRSLRLDGDVPWGWELTVYPDIYKDTYAWLVCSCSLRCSLVEKNVTVKMLVCYLNDEGRERCNCTGARQ